MCLADANGCSGSKQNVICNVFVLSSLMFSVSGVLQLTKFSLQLNLIFYFSKHQQIIALLTFFVLATFDSTACKMK